MSLNANDDCTLDAIGDVRLYQRRKGYRFGTEAPFLAACAGEKRFQKAAELGTGAGVIAILLASHRKNGTIDAVEIQTGLAELARRNVELNGLQERIRIVEGDVRDLPWPLTEGTYDLVFGNPPFGRETAGRSSPNPERNRARREETVTLDEWLSAAARLLRNRGRCCLVFTPDRLPALFENLRRNRLEPKRARFAHHSLDYPPCLVYVEAAKAGRAGFRIERPFVLHPQAKDSCQRLVG